MTFHFQSLFLRVCLIAILSRGLPQSIQAQTTPQLNRRFAKKVSVKTEDEPVGMFLHNLAKEHDVVIEIDTFKIAADGFSIDDEISLSLNDVSLFTVVKLASESVGLVTFPEGVGLAVTTQFFAEEVLYEKQYNLPWIRVLRVDSRSIAAAIETTTPGPWMTIDAEGGEFTAIAPAAFKIKQNWESHQVIENVLFQIESIVRGRGEKQIPPVELALLKTLQKTVAQEAREVPLQEYLDKLLFENEINYWIDRAELDNEGISSEVLVNITGGKKTIHAHLTEALKAHGLVPYVENEVIKITTNLAAREALVTRVYDVRQQLRQVGSVTAVADILMKTEGTAPWFGIEQAGGELEEVGPLLIIQQHRQAHQIIREALK